MKTIKRLSFWIKHPSWFPADPCGRWDATHVFNRKLSKPGPCHVPAGTFKVQTLAIRAGVTVWGESPYMTTVVLSKPLDIG
jgi:hypothetical protein